MFKLEKNKSEIRHESYINPNKIYFFDYSG